MLVLRSSAVDALKYKEVIEKIDSTLTVSVDKNPINALKLLATTQQDIVVLDEQIGQMSALDFIQNTKQLPQKEPLKSIVFCLVVAKMPDYETAEEARRLGVQYFIPEQNMDALFDSVRMAL